MGKLPELAQISKWKCFRAAAVLAQQDDGLASVVCCAAGYRAADDKYAAQKKVRLHREGVIHIV